MAKDDNMAPGQQNAPEVGKTVYRPDQATGEEIIEGAQQDDQLASLAGNVAQAPAGHHLTGSQTKNELTQQDIKDGVNTFEQQTGEHSALETKEGKNNGAIPSAFKGQTSNHP